MPIIKEWVEKDATLITDGHGAYATANTDFNHEIIQHSKDEYVKNGMHTNRRKKILLHFIVTLQN